MTLLETAIGMAAAIGLVVLAGVGVILACFPRRLTRADIEAEDWMGDRQ